MSTFFNELSQGDTIPTSTLDEMSVDNAIIERKTIYPISPTLISANSPSFSNNKTYCPISPTLISQKSHEIPPLTINTQNDICMTTNISNNINDNEYMNKNENVNILTMDDYFTHSNVKYDNIQSHTPNNINTNSDIIETEINLRQVLLSTGPYLDPSYETKEPNPLFKLTQNIIIDKEYSTNKYVSIKFHKNIISNDVTMSVIIKKECKNRCFWSGPRGL